MNTKRASHSGGPLFSACAFYIDQATRFLRDLEIRLVQGENCAAVDLFPPRHAEKVLTAQYVPTDQWAAD